MHADQPLDSGYGPAARPGDNLCNDFQLETAQSFAVLGEARGDRVHRIAGELTMADAGSPLPFANRAVLEQPLTDPDAVEHAVKQLRAFYRTAGDGPFLLDSAWPTPDLRSHGFMLMGHPPLMVRPPNIPLPAGPPELRIVAVTDGAAAADFERTLIDGYPAPMLQPFERVRLFTPAALTAAGWTHFVGYVDDRPVATGSTYVGGQLLRVDNIATLEAARGRGYGLAITAATIAADLTKTASLIASDLGRPIYERLGFVAMSRATYWLGSR
jgi:GNAT superfamily N-acetyltransferase